MILEILIIIFFITSIGAAVYFLTKPATSTINIHEDLLNEVATVFGIKVQENLQVQTTQSIQPTQTTQVIKIVFNSFSDIQKNIATFVKFAFPKMNKDSINSLLKKYSLNKTVDEILKDYNNTPIKDFKTDILQLLGVYFLTLFDETDNNELMYSIRLFHIVYFYVSNIEIKDKIITYEGVNEFYFELPADYKTTDRNKFLNLYASLLLSDIPDRQNNKWLLRKSNKDPQDASAPPHGTNLKELKKTKVSERTEMGIRTPTERSGEDSCGVERIVTIFTHDTDEWCD
jgi:hypothetical protein